MGFKSAFKGLIGCSIHLSNMRFFTIQNGTCYSKTFHVFPDNIISL